MKEATKTKLEELAARAPYSNTPGRELGELIGALLADAEPVAEAPAPAPAPAPAKAAAPEGEAA